MSFRACAEAKNMERAPTTLRTPAAELGYGIMPRVSFDPSGWDRDMRTLTLPDRRCVGAVRGEAACRRPPRLSSLSPRKPQSGEGSGSSSYSTVRVPLAGGWQDHWLLPMSGNLRQHRTMLSAASCCRFAP